MSARDKIENLLRDVEEEGAQWVLDNLTIMSDVSDDGRLTVHTFISDGPGSCGGSEPVDLLDVLKLDARCAVAREPGPGAPVPPNQRADLLRQRGAIERTMKAAIAHIDEMLSWT